MKENKISFLIKKITNNIIDEHNKGMLGTINMKDYILNKCPNINDSEYNKILLGIGNSLANIGYEIKNDIDKFDIINFNSKEYKKYLNNLK